MYRNRGQALKNIDRQSVIIVQRDTGLRRELGTAPERKRPLLAEDLREIWLDLPDSQWGKRDGALLLLGFTGAFRRSERVAWDDHRPRRNPRGTDCHLRKSQTDQEGQGRRGLPPGAEEASCPLWALKVWRAEGGITEGAVFRVMNRHDQVLPKRLSGEGVGIVVKRYVEGLGFDPSQFAGDSLRAGLATSAAARQIRTRHPRPNRAPQREHRAALYPRRKSLPGKCG
jgi:hypothetical protein